MTETPNPQTRTLPEKRRSERVVRTPRPFTLLNIPKTGTTYVAQFVRNADALSDAHRLGLRRLAPLVRRQPTLRCISDRLSRKLRVRRMLRSGHMNPRYPHPEHEFHCRLPPDLRELPAISILREPLSWHVSRYIHTFRIHLTPQMLRLLEQELRSPEPARRDVTRSFIKEQMGGEFTVEAWQSVSLEAYWRFLQDSRRTERNIEKDFNVRPAEDFPLGLLGYRAMMLTHREPQKLFSMRAQEAEEYFLSGRWREDLCDVLFLRHERLQKDLYSALLERMGYRKETLDATLELMPDKVNAADPQRKARALRELEQKPRLREEILRSERIYSHCILPLSGNFFDD